MLNLIEYACDRAAPRTNIPPICNNLVKGPLVPNFALLLRPAPRRSSLIIKASNFCRDNCAGIDCCVFSSTVCTDSQAIGAGRPQWSRRRISGAAFAVLGPTRVVCSTRYGTCHTDYIVSNVSKTKANTVLQGSIDNANSTQ